MGRYTGSTAASRRGGLRDRLGYNAAVMRFLDTQLQTPLEIEAILNSRPDEKLAQIETTVREILEAIRRRADAAILTYTQKLDWPNATLDCIEIDISNVTGGDSDLARTLAASRIFDYHAAELEQYKSWTRNFGTGIELGQLIQPVARAGVYVPGGKAVYPSTVLMAAIPPIVAGVNEIVFCTPANSSGQVSPVVIDTIACVADLARERGATVRAFKLGGAVAIGALAYGSSLAGRVDVIVGPGNHYVNIAKRIVYGDVGIDMLAGPSDVAIIADHGAIPSFVASDLLAQTEHGPENRGILLSPCKALIQAVRVELKRRRAGLSRKAILELSDSNLYFVTTRDLSEAVSLSNRIAPEHLELQVRDPDALLGAVKNAGAILLGDYTSAPIGDYMAGPSHTLPTGGAARFSSPLSVTTFLKRSSILKYSRQAACDAAEAVASFAQSEGFDAHADAAMARTSEPTPLPTIAMN